MPKLKRQSKSQRIGANRSLKRQSREDGSARSAQDGNLKEAKPAAGEPVDASDTNKGVKSKGVSKVPSSQLKKTRSSSKRPDHARFNEDVDHQAARSPSRLGYSRDNVPIIIEGCWVENGEDDSKLDNFDLLDLDGTESDHDGQGEDSHKTVNDSLELQTKDNAQQTELSPGTDSSRAFLSDRKEIQTRQFVSSRKFLVEKGNSPKHPYEKTLFFVKTAPNSQTGDKPGVTSTVYSPISPVKPDSRQSLNHTPLTNATRVDSGYASRPDTCLETQTETIRIHSPEVPKHSEKRQDNYSSSETKNQPSSSKASKMSYFNPTDVIPPHQMSARKQEREDLQVLNERFTTYVQKVRQLSDGSRLDADAVIQQARVLEVKVADLKTLYERELEAVRQELHTISQERNNYQLQSQKHKQSTLDMESRLVVECDKNRRLVDTMNQVQQRTANMEAELQGLRQAGDGRTDLHGLQRELDNVIRENQTLKHRQEQDSLLRTEAEDRCHTLTKKLEFNEQVSSQQMSELHEHLEQSSAVIVTLESRLRDFSKMDNAVPEVLKQVRESAEMELRRYQVESEETYNRNITALKCQMDNDARTIERLNADNSLLQGQIGELNAKIRTLEGQMATLVHQKETVEGLIDADKKRSADRVQEMERRLHEMQELLFSKMREASSAREANVPLKSEIDTMKFLLEEEEKRLQSTTATSYQHQQQTSYVQPSTQLPVVQQPTPGQQYVHPTPLQRPPDTYHRDPGSHAAQHTYVQQQETTQEQHFTHDSTAHDFTVGSTKYLYEATPSMNRLQIETSPRSSPRVVGPISRAKSAPVQTQSQSQPVSLVPSSLGQGKDYFDEMFRDLTRETLYTQTRSKNCSAERPPPEVQSPTERSPSKHSQKSPVERPQSGRETPERAQSVMERPRSVTERHSPIERPHSAERPPSTERPHSTERPPSTERPHSSVFHDYTTTTSSATGEIKILEVNQDGRFVRLVNEGKKEAEFGGYMIQQNVGGHPVAVYRFPPRTKFPEASTLTVWSGTTEPIEHQPPKNYVWKEQHRWGTGPECTTILCKPNGQAIAWTTAAHRFAQNPFEESAKEGSPDSDVRDETDFIPQPAASQEVLTAMNVNLNEPKPDSVFLKREKQSPLTLSAQKHPHGTNPGRETHPHTGQPRPFTYGNDNSSVNRQSRSQSTRPDPVQGQPYAGGSANRLGSAPLRRYTAGENVRGSGSIANRADPGVTSPPPSPFHSPQQQFQTGLDQIQSQHHPDFLPPMPRPPLFSAW